MDYSGSDIDLHYDASGKSPTDSAFMQIQAYVNIDSSFHFYLTPTVTGEFINKPGTNSGTIYFNLTLPSSVIVIGTFTATVTVEYVYLMDYNLVKSNVIIPQ
jgi:hypothetical protein